MYFVVIWRVAVSAAVVVALVLVTILVLVVLIGIRKTCNCGFVCSKFINFKQRREFPQGMTDVHWSRWPRSLRHGSAASHFLGLWVRTPTGAWLYVCCEYCVLSGRGLCDEMITHWCVVVCGLGISRMRKPWPALGRSATRGGGTCPGRLTSGHLGVGVSHLQFCLHLDSCTDCQSAKSYMGGLGFHSLSLQKEKYYYYHYYCYYLLFNSLATMNNLNYIQTVGLYRAVNTFRLGKCFQGNYCFWLWDKYQTHKHNLWVDGRIFNIKQVGAQSKHQAFKYYYKQHNKNNY